MTSYAYSAPMLWPRDVPRHKGVRERGPFARVQPSSAIYDLEAELRKLGATNVAITVTATILRNGRPTADDLARRAIDPGVAIYLRRGKRDLVFALDRYQTAKDNLRALTLAIDGLRRVERYGGPGMEDRALAGFAALPSSTASSWRVVLGLAGDDIVTLERAEHAYRQLALKHHPDRPGGSHDGFVELGRAIAEARKELART